MYPELEGKPLLGQRASFERGSIEALSRGGINPMLLERAVHCLEYIAQMGSTGLRFVFKGGTACQLLPGGDLQRLSIDVDVATDAPAPLVMEALDEIKARMGGTIYVHAPLRRKMDDGIPLLMFNITAPSYYPVQTRETMIKLDVVLHEPLYELRTTPLRSFYYGSDLVILTPSPSAMLGDKLSALGPNTIGLPAERVVDNFKQFYDIGNLLALGFEVRAVRDAYVSCFREVSAWRRLDISIDDAHDDLEGWCKMASALPHYSGDDVGGERGSQIRRLAEGLEGFSGYIRRANRLTKRRLRDIASRIALFSRLLRAGAPESTLYDYVRDPKRFQGAVVNGFQTILDGVSAVPREDRWHVHIPEYQNSPLALAAWYGYWDPEGLEVVLGSIRGPPD